MSIVQQIPCAFAVKGAERLSDTNRYVQPGLAQRRQFRLHDLELTEIERAKHEGAIP